MAYIKRSLDSLIKPYLFRGKAIIIYGARQVGKTTFIKHMHETMDRKSMYLNCDERDVQERLTDVTSTQLQELIGTHEVVFLDEAQRIRNIGLTIKLLVDTLPNVQIIATGSSVLDLSNSVSEPLTGRNFEFRLYPFSLQELSERYDALEIRRLLADRMVNGMYPEPVMQPDIAQEVLRSISSGYLYKDILQYQEIRRPEVLDKLLLLLALQAGQLVSYNELANELGTRKETVASYIHLLERVFVIFRLGPYSRNQRNELKRMQKIYFYDNGIRNVLINNLNSLEFRQDTGALWEQFMISERMKYVLNRGGHPNTFFWRDTQKHEVDYLEEEGGELAGFEFKWRKGNVHVPRAFTKAYPECAVKTINRENFAPFVGLE